MDFVIGQYICNMVDIEVKDRTRYNRKLAYAAIAERNILPRPHNIYIENQKIALPLHFCNFVSHVIS